ncbi:MAG: redoxin domain-containing protein [Planctomycetota bacterium]|nr:redoxin domain-containing protein [Planctomycetota bacterium]
MPLDTGQAAPDFALYDGDGNVVKLSDMRGAPVVVAFFPAAFTGVCEKELCTFRDSMTAFHDVGAQVVGVSVDSRFANAAFAAANNLTFPILSDYNRETIKSWDLVFPDLAGMTGYDVARRSVYVIDGTGNVSWCWLSDSPGDEPPYAEVQDAVTSLTQTS